LQATAGSEAADKNSPTENVNIFASRTVISLCLKLPRLLIRYLPEKEQFQTCLKTSMQ
jgi:hypothetical protein